MTDPEPAAASDEELQTTITGPENAAPDSPQRNRPQWPDLPVDDDTANLRQGPDLHEACLGLLPLVGTWRGTGEVVYPTIEGPFHFGQQITWAHDGRPFLSYEARSWLLDDDGGIIRQAARETGFWRPQEDGSIEVEDPSAAVSWIVSAPLMLPGKNVLNLGALVAFAVLTVVFVLSPQMWILAVLTVLALLLGADIVVADAVLTVAGVDPSTVVVEGLGTGSGELEAFRRFLDTATPDDFDEPPR